MMKNLFRLFLFAALAGGLAACTRFALPHISPDDPLAMAPDEVVESFYNWLLEYPGNPISSGDYQSSPFLTAEYLDQIEQELSGNRPGGVDPFLCAQDVPEKVSVQPAVLDDSQASVRVFTSFEGHSFIVRLAQKEREWKITGITCNP
jgi:hypothetical protein